MQEILHLFYLIKVRSCQIDPISHNHVIAFGTIEYLAIFLGVNITGNFDI